MESVNVAIKVCLLVLLVAPGSSVPAFLTQHPPPPCPCSPASPPPWWSQSLSWPSICGEPWGGRRCYQCSTFTEMLNGQGKKTQDYRESKQHKCFSKERLFSTGSWWPLPWWEARAQYAVCEGETLHLYAEFGRLIGLRFMETTRDLKIRIRRNRPWPGHRCRSSRGPSSPWGQETCLLQVSVE